MPSWNLAPLDVGASDVRTFSFTANRTLPSTSNPFTVGAMASALESDLAPPDNSTSDAGVLLAWPDLQITLDVDDLTAPTTLIEDGDTLQHVYTYQNVGSAPAEGVTIVGHGLGPSDTAGIQWFAGGSFTSPNVTFTHPTPLDPGQSSIRSAFFRVASQAMPPTRRTFTSVADVSEAAYGTTRDANAADNTTQVTISPCYMSAAIIDSGPNPVCIQGGVPGAITLLARTTPATGLAYQWSEVGGQGTFTTPNAASTMFHPPVTPGPAGYTVQVVVTDTSTGCTVTTTTGVATATACSACGCDHNPPVRINYNGGLSRVDRVGDNTCSRGETVAFQAYIQERNNARAVILRAGVTKMTFTSNGATYTAGLAGDVYIECSSTVLLVFDASTVPPLILAQPHLVSFDFVWDECDATPARRSSRDDSGTDRIVVLPTPFRAVDPGVTFTEWGPDATPP
jgi:hypothetical protein